MTLNIGQRTSSATGGTISTISGYTVHTFTSSGNFVPTGSGTIEVLVVGGGGANSSNGGGGGGGNVIYNKLANVTSGTPYLITVGGAPGGISSCTFNNVTMIAYGGGNGASGNVAGSPSINASGGGGDDGATGGTGIGITGLGFSGGGGNAPSGSGGGGGGAGGAGGPAGAGPLGGGGNGGIGVSYNITGFSSYYGGGGGGDSGSGSEPIGVPNGGIPGASYGTGGTPGAVIIRYPT